MRKLLFLVPLVLVLSGCQPDGAAVSLTPPSVEDCGASTAPVAINIHWDARQANPKHGVKVWVSNQPVPTHSGVFGSATFGTLWAAGSVTGARTTGPWVFPGMTITVTDRDGRVLKQLRVPAGPCRKG